MAPAGHRQVRNRKKALSCHPDKELGDIFLLGSRELILELSAHVYKAGSPIPSGDGVSSTTGASYGGGLVKGAQLGKQQEREDVQDYCNNPDTVERT